MPSTSEAPPLSGVVIVDLSRVLAGPFCTLVLAELGATVIKIERPEGGDDARAFGPFQAGASAYFASVNRGKRSLALDLSATPDRALFDRLLAVADVLVENFRPGALARLGYGWEALHARFPRLIYGAVSGFGHTGPASTRPAYDMVIQGLCGLMSVTGEPGGDPVRVGTSIADLSAGLFLSSGLLAALFDRSRTGRGRMVDVAMLDCQLALLENAVARLAVSGQAPGPTGRHHPAIAPFGAFRAADGWLTLAAGNDALFVAAAQALGVPAWAHDPRFATNAARCAHLPALVAAIEARLANGPVAHWLAALEAAGVPSGPVRDVAQALADPQVAARNMLVTSHGGEVGSLAMAGNPVKMSGAPDPITRAPAPRLDADRPAVLAWLAAHEAGDHQAAL